MAQMQLTLAKADSEQLARSIADEQLADVEKAKTMLELQMKEVMQRHKTDIKGKDISISTVSRQSQSHNIVTAISLVLTLSASVNNAGSSTNTA